MVAHPSQLRHPTLIGFSRPRAAHILALLAIGIAGWIFFFGNRYGAFLTLGPWGWPALLLFTVVVGSLALMPPTAAMADRLLALVRAPTAKRRQISSVTVVLFTAGYLLQTALFEHRQMFPYVHDEFSYLIQAHEFAGGHLWMSPHSLAPFFDSFQLIIKPVYASAYFPGTAIVHVPGIWMHLPAWVTSLGIAGLIAGLLYRITTELIDGVAGWMAVLLLWSDRTFRSLSTMTLSQAPLLLFALLAMLSWMKWRHSRRARWAVCIGLFTGLAAITRPLDALCFAIPIAVAMLFDSCPRDTPSRFFASVLCVVAGALPLLALQLIINRGITGHVLETPFRFYADRDYPGTAYGFHPVDPLARPASDLPQKLAMYREYQPIIQHHQFWPAVMRTLRFRIPLALTQGTPAPFALLLPLLPVAVIGMTRRRAVLLFSLPIFILLYAGYAFFFSHYVLSASAAVIVGLLLGANQIQMTSVRRRRFLVVFSTLFIAGVAVAGLPQCDATSSDDQFNAPLITEVNHQLARLPRLPAIVLFTYDPGRNTNEEPVYNSDSAWPDDASVIRAHDLGPMNVHLYRYYAKHQPGRFVYRFDERTRTLAELGIVKKLAVAPGNPG